MNFLNFLSSGFNLMGFHLTSQERLGSGIFRGSSPAIDVSKISTEAATSKPSADASKIDQPRTDPKAQQEALQPVISQPNTTKQRQEEPQAVAPLNQLLAEQNQLLLSQYIQLNLQLMNKQIEQTNVKTEEVVEERSRVHRKKIKKVTACQHKEKEHYAKGFCKNCYLKYGRTKKPWLCQHEKLYAGGLCQNCYINKYNKEKRTRELETERQQSSEHHDAI